MEGARRRCPVTGVSFVILLASLLAACRSEQGRALRVLETVPLADSAATLAVDTAGRRWLGRPGAVSVRDPAGAVRDLPLPGGDAARVVGWMAGRTYLRVGDTLLVVSPGADSVVGARAGFGENPLIADARGRAVLQGASSGAVLAHDPLSLEPVWAWAALGASTTALTVSPEGDRVYQALESDEGDRWISIRDLQTGRELGRLEVELPLGWLVAGDDGTLYGAGREGSRVVVVALRPGGGELALLWRTSLGLAERSARFRIASAGGLVAVWGRGEGEGLRILDASSGDVMARTGNDPLDFSFGPRGELWALYPGQVRRLE